MKVFHDMSACPPAKLLKDPTNIKEMLKVLVEAERCAIRGYTHICNLTAGKDHRTYDLATDLTEALKQAPHGEEVLKRFPIVGVLRKKQ